VLFYHFEPDPFHVKHKGKFDRVFLPPTAPERVRLSTGDFGENGFGQRTDNPVDVDFPVDLLMKYAASIVEDLPIGSVLRKFTLSDENINELLSEFIAASEDANMSQPYFHAACNWVKQNYDIWSEWVERLPSCTLEEHVATRIIGCEAGSSVRQIEFL
jgi:gamma-aminobutyric acid type B receptor